MRRPFVVPKFRYSISLLIAIFFVQQGQAQNMENSENAEIIFPGEWEQHERSFMVWPSSANIWGSSLLPKVQEDIVRIAQAISKYEPVTVIVSPKDAENATNLLGTGIEMLQIEVNDLWARDTLPVFVLRKSATTNGNESTTTIALNGIDFNFNGWGNKQEFGFDGNLAKEFLKLKSIERKKAAIVGEGGSFETDGNGTLLITESSVINKNRNAGKSKTTIETELKHLLGVKKIIWFPGVEGQDITDAHVDSLVRFIEPGKVMVNRPINEELSGEIDVWAKVSNEILQILKSSTDAYNRQLKIIEITDADPSKIDNILGDKSTFLTSYVNYYVINNAVIIPEFGDKEADNRAAEIFKENFPGRQIVPVKINALASGGGGIHCATHELPASNKAGPNKQTWNLLLGISALFLILVYTYI